MLGILDVFFVFWKELKVLFNFIWRKNISMKYEIEIFWEWDLVVVFVNIKMVDESEIFFGCFCFCVIFWEFWMNGNFKFIDSCFRIFVFWSKRVLFLFRGVKVWESFKFIGFFLRLG